MGDSGVTTLTDVVAPVWYAAGARKRESQERVSIVQERALVEKCIEGNRAAQHELFTTYRTVVLRLVWRLLGPRSDQELDDAIQLVFIEVFRSLSRFRWEAKLDTWVHRICTRVCMSQLRTRYRRRKREYAGDGNALVERTAAKGGGPEKSAERAEIARAIYDALDRIDKGRRVVFVLAEIESKSLEEISEIIDRPIGTVKSRLFRARRDLATLLHRYMDQ